MKIRAKRKNSITKESIIISKGNFFRRSEQTDRNHGNKGIKKTRSKDFQLILFE